MKRTLETFSLSIPSRVFTLGQAHLACATLVRSHYENFPVASVWIPSTLRPAVAAVYAFARCADDFADEPGLDPEGRLALLGDWRRRLHSVDSHGGHPVFWALADVLRRQDLPLDPFDRLITAFEMDVRRNRHADFDDLLHYCRHSADPVGELVLRIFGAWTPQRGVWSDRICTALQLANFWQDVTVDALKDRIYIPVDEMKGLGVSESEVLRGPASEPLRRIVARLTDKTWDLFLQGHPLLEDAPRALRAELRLVWMGGTEILRKIEKQRFDVWSRRPTVTRWDWARLFGRLLLGGPSPVKPACSV